MDDAFESSHERLISAAGRMLKFAAGVIAAPSLNHTWHDGPDPFERNVATIASQIARLALPLPTLASIASGLEQSANGSWDRLAHELRGCYPDLSDMHFAAVVVATLEATRDVALTMPANHVDSGARLKLFAMGLGVVAEHREKIRALLLHDIDVLLAHDRDQDGRARADPSSNGPQDLGVSRRPRRTCCRLSGDHRTDPSSSRTRCSS